jgi:hypothetical protein
VGGDRGIVREVSKGRFGLAGYTLLWQRYVIGGVLGLALQRRDDRQGDLLCSDGPEWCNTSNRGPLVRIE